MAIYRIGIFEPDLVIPGAKRDMTDLVSFGIGKVVDGLTRHENSSANKY